MIKDTIITLEPIKKMKTISKLAYQSGEKADGIHV